MSAPELTSSTVVARESRSASKQFCLSLQPPGEGQHKASQLFFSLSQTSFAQKTHRSRLLSGFLLMASVEEVPLLPFWNRGARSFQGSWFARKPHVAFCGWLDYPRLSPSEDPLYSWTPGILDVLPHASRLSDYLQLIAGYKFQAPRGSCSL